jgi:hypothetical protein
VDSKTRTDQDGTHSKDLRKVEAVYRDERLDSAVLGGAEIDQFIADVQAHKALAIERWRCARLG